MLARSIEPYYLIQQADAGTSYVQSFASAVIFVMHMIWFLTRA